MFVLLTEVKPCWVKLLLGWVVCCLVLFFFCSCPYFLCHSSTLKSQHQIYFPLKTRVTEGEEQCIPQ